MGSCASVPNDANNTNNTNGHRQTNKPTKMTVITVKSPKSDTYLDDVSHPSYQNSLIYPSFARHSVSTKERSDKEGNASPEPRTGMARSTTSSGNIRDIE